MPDAPAPRINACLQQLDEIHECNGSAVFLLCNVNKYQVCQSIGT